MHPVVPNRRQMIRDKVEPHEEADKYRADRLCKQMRVLFFRGMMGRPVNSVVLKLAYELRC